MKPRPFRSPRSRGLAWDSTHLIVWTVVDEDGGFGFTLRRRVREAGCGRPAIWRHRRLQLWVGSPTRRKRGKGTRKFEYDTWLSAGTQGTASRRIGLKSFVRLKFGFGDR